MKDALLSPAKELAGLNASSLSGYDWTTFRNRVGRLIIEAVAANVTASSDEHIERLKAARTVHDTVYIADRIRKEALRKRSPVPTDLLVATDLIVAKPYAGSTSPNRRSAQEERYVVGARVNWHKLLKRTRSQVLSGSADTMADLRALTVKRLTALIGAIRDVAATSSAPDLRAVEDALQECLEKCRKA